MIGVFANYDFANIHGTFGRPRIGIYTGKEKIEFELGGWRPHRLGGVPGPLTYFSAGYTEATFDRTNLSSSRKLFRPT